MVPGIAHKLNTYEGVFVPTTLNVLSILIYLRFGFIVGQAGISGSLMLLVLSYTINLLTTLSVSAIATNGVVQGGGAYFMISRSLGAEFGGSIGVVFYMGQVLNAGLNVAGCADSLLAKFGRSAGSFARALPDSSSWRFFYETVMLLFCTIICLRGPQMFARSSKLLFMILLVATVAVPFSSLVVRPFLSSEFDAWYTGPSWSTIVQNWKPHFTKGAAGGDPHHVENFRNLFGIAFSASSGILAGASMSGDLATPSRSIPKGTLWGLALTFMLYGSVICTLGASVSRELLWRDVDVISTVDISPALVMLGQLSTSIFSALMGTVGAAKLLQAIAKDDIVPCIGLFSKGTTPDDNPRVAILATYALTQLTLLLDVNQIAVYITMAFLMTFVVINLACFLLEIAAAPNFRPSFHYFNERTAFLGFLVCIAAMLAADPIAALSILLLTISVFIMIHSYSAPKPWGDVSQSIIYHQVRKYLLLLKQDHVKYWRPQILLMVDDPRSGWQLIRFCNYLKKGGIFILGHVIIVSDEFQKEAVEINRQRSSWEKLRSSHKIKAFFQITASPSIVWGVRNVYLGSGLGGMRPNITVLGFYDEHQTNQGRDFVDVEALPTDSLRKESHLTIQQWVEMIEDLLSLGSNVCVAKGFINADLPAPTPLFKWRRSSKTQERCDKAQYIDLYPIQMSARLQDSEGHNNGLSINFDTYTLILQLGSILYSVKAWTTTHQLRVIVFVEKETEIKRETSKIAELLDTLRINAQLVVRSLDRDNEIYDIIVKGAPDVDGRVSTRLPDSNWWAELCRARKDGTASSAAPAKQTNSFVVPHVIGRKRRTFSSLQQLGVSHSIQSTRWLHNELNEFYGSVTDDNLDGSSSSDSESEHSYRYATEDPDISATDNNLPMNQRASAISDSSSSASEHDGENSGSEGGSAKAETLQLQSEVANEPSSPLHRSSANDEAGPSFQDDPMEATDLGGARVEFCRSVSRGVKSRFNDLPARAQHLILNCLMRQVSSEATTIFTTLPAPALGVHKDETAAKKYHASLQLLCEGLPPMALIHAQSMTVTTEL